MMNTRITTTLTLLLTAAFAVPAMADHHKMLEGKYTIVKGFDGEKELPQGLLRGSVTMVQGNTITSVDKDENKTYVSTFKLGEPVEGKEGLWNVTFTVKFVAGKTLDKEVTAPGLLKKTKNGLRMKYATKGDIKLKGLKAQEGTNLFVLKKQK